MTETLFSHTPFSTVTDDGRVMKALNTRSPVSRNDSNQVIVSDVQVLKYGTYISAYIYILYITVSR